jgi:hypothetical protein
MPMHLFIDLLTLLMNISIRIKNGRHLLLCRKQKLDRVISLRFQILFSGKEEQNRLLNSRFGSDRTFGICSFVCNRASSILDNVLSTRNLFMVPITLRFNDPIFSLIIALSLAFLYKPALIVQNISNKSSENDYFKSVCHCAKREEYIHLRDDDIEWKLHSFDENVNLSVSANEMNSCINEFSNIFRRMP